MKPTSPSEDLGTGRLGNLTSASLTSMEISGGASSSSYSRAWRRSRSGDARRSESGPDPVGDAGAGLKAMREGSANVAGDERMEQRKN